MSQVVVQPSQEILVVQVGQTTGGPGGGGGVALGETSSTAYRGDRGKIAYDHSQQSTFPPSSHTHSQYGDKSTTNVWALQQTFESLFSKITKLAATEMTSSGSWPVDKTIVLANIPDSSTTLNCGDDPDSGSEAGCLGVADGCVWLDPATTCGDFGSSGPCAAIAGCSWNLYYCEDLTDEMSCIDQSSCSWNLVTDDCAAFDGDEAGCISHDGCTWEDPNCTGSMTTPLYGCTGGFLDQQCEGTPELPGCTGTYLSGTLPTIDFTEFLESQIAIIKNINEDYGLVLVDDDETFANVGLQQYAVVTKLGGVMKVVMTNA